MVECVVFTHIESDEIMKKMKKYRLLLVLLAIIAGTTGVAYDWSLFEPTPSGEACEQGDCAACRTGGMAGEIFNKDLGGYVRDGRNWNLGGTSWSPAANAMQAKRICDYICRQRYHTYAAQVVCSQGDIGCNCNVGSERVQANR